MGPLRLLNAAIALYLCAAATVPRPAACAGPPPGAQTPAGGQTPAAAPEPSATQAPSGSNRPVADKWALIIGVSRFKDSSINLKYPSKDASDFYQYLVTDGHFARDHVRLLTDGDATRERILDELGDKWLPRVAGPNDLVIIYISSHGSASDMDVGGVNYIVAYDTDKERLYSTGIAMQDLCRIIKGRVHSDRTLIVLDACHSGAVTPDSKGLARSGNVNIEEVVQGTGQLVLSSSMPSEVSWESTKQSNSVFTRHLIEAFKSQGANTKLGDAYQYLKDRVEEEVRLDRGVTQTPILRGKWQGNELVLATPPVSPRPGIKDTTPPKPVQAPAPKPEATTYVAPTATSGTVTIWTTYLDTGLKAYANARYKDAEVAFKSALTEAEKFGPRDVRVMKTLDCLAVSCLQQGKLDEALPMLERVVAEDKRNNKMLTADGTHHLDQLAFVRFSKGQFAEAEPIFTQTLENWEFIMGSEHPKVATSLIFLGNCEREQGNYAAAEPLYSRALAIFESELGADNVAVARALSCLGTMYGRQGNQAECDKAFKRAIGICEKPRRVTPEDLASVLVAYGDVAAADNKYSKAQQLYARALDTRVADKKNGSRYVPETLSRLVELNKTQTKSTKAQEYEQMLAGSTARSGPTASAEIGQALKSIGLEPPDPPPFFAQPWEVLSADELGFKWPGKWEWDSVKKQFNCFWDNGMKGVAKFEKYRPDELILLYRGSVPGYGKLIGRFVGKQTGTTIRGTTDFMISTYQSSHGLWQASW